MASSKVFANMLLSPTTPTGEFLFAAPETKEKDPDSNNSLVKNLLQIRDMLTDCESLTMQTSFSKERSAESPHPPQSPPPTPVTEGSSVHSSSLVPKLDSNLPHAITIPSSAILYAGQRSHSYDFSVPTSPLGFFSPISAGLMHEPVSPFSPMSGGSVVGHRKSVDEINLNLYREARIAELESKEDASNDEEKIEKKLYPCPHPGCERRFTRLYNVKSHLVCHSGERPFACSVCPSSFRRKHDLQRHYRTTHSNVRPWVCEKCHRTFARRDHYRRHMQVEEATEQKRKAAMNDLAKYHATLRV